MDCGPRGSCPTGYICHTSDNTSQMAGALDAALADVRPVPPDAKPDAMPGSPPDTTITQAFTICGDHAVDIRATDPCGNSSDSTFSWQSFCIGRPIYDSGHDSSTP